MSRLRSSSEIGVTVPQKFRKSYVQVTGSYGHVTEFVPEIRKIPLVTLMLRKSVADKTEIRGEVTETGYGNVRHTRGSYGNRRSSYGKDDGCYGHVADL